MILHFRMQKQILDNWCWAAVTSSVAFYFNKNSGWIQSALASHMIDNVCSGINVNTAQTAPPVCNTTMDIAKSLTLTGNFRGNILRQLSFNEVIQQINAGFPICCQIVFPGIDTSHIVAIYGYESSNVIIGDPQAGIFSIHYNSFVANYRMGTWRRTIGTKAKDAITVFDS